MCDGPAPLKTTRSQLGATWWLRLGSDLNCDQSTTDSVGGDEV